jgi:hypothetical protein
MSDSFLLKTVTELRFHAFTSLLDLQGERLRELQGGRLQAVWLLDQVISPLLETIDALERVQEYQYSGTPVAPTLDIFDQGSSSSDTDSSVPALLSESFYG